ncbi:MAG: hypothetical protein JO276_08765 [Sphingomonadaceae bacterium]|nr:hypothetical protein [Sphingomonadaceae bacterium]
MPTDLQASASAPPERHLRPTTIERAFELARSGECRTMPELKHRLRREQMESVDMHLGGKLTRTQLTELMLRAG